VSIHFFRSWMLFGGCYILLFVLLSTMASTNAGWVEMEAGKRPDPSAMVEGSAQFEDEAEKGDTHSVSFHLVGRNADLLEKTLSEVSDPKHPRYGKYLTKEEVHEMTADTEGMTKIESYLQNLSSQAESEGLGKVEITKKTDSAITAEAKIGVWEKAFNTKFFKVRHTNTKDGNPEVINRAKQYFLPEDLVPHVRMVMGTVQIPVKLSRGPIRIDRHRGPHLQQDAPHK
jgi:hypothetical protein